MTGARRITGVLVLIAASAGVLSDASGARSFPAVSGTLTIKGDPGHPLGRGQMYSFAARAIEFGATETTAAGVEELTVSTREGGFWSVRLSAPEGSRLEAGEYVDNRGLYDEDFVLIAVHDGVHACGSSTGRFTILDIEYGPPGYVRLLRAKFEQHCDGEAAALRGEIDIAAAPAPPRLSVDVSLDAHRTWVAADGLTMGLLGTITCSQAVDASVSAQVREVNTGGTGGGMSSVTRCSRTQKEWFVPVTAQGGIEFTDDKVQISVVGQAPDRW